MEGAEVEKEESGGSGARTHCDGRVVGLLETPWRRVLARVLEMEAAAMLLLTSESTAYDTGEGSWVRGLAKSNELPRGRRRRRKKANGFTIWKGFSLLCLLQLRIGQI